MGSPLINKDIPVSRPVVIFEHDVADVLRTIVHDHGFGAAGPYLLDSESHSHDPELLAYYFTDPLVRMIRRGEID